MSTTFLTTAFLETEVAYVLTVDHYDPFTLMKGSVDL